VKLTMAKANEEGHLAPAPIDGPIVQYKLIVKPCAPLVAWIRSEFPVKSLKDSTRIYIERLSAALSDGVAAQRDSSAVTSSRSSSVTSGCTCTFASTFSPCTLLPPRTRIFRAIVEIPNELPVANWQ